MRKKRSREREEVESSQVSAAAFLLVALQKTPSLLGAECWGENNVPSVIRNAQTIMLVSETIMLVSDFNSSTV